MVDGSELMLDSSNFSRYGNLMINATVTEQATGMYNSEWTLGMINATITEKATGMPYKDSRLFMC